MRPVSPQVMGRVHGAAAVAALVLALTRITVAVAVAVERVRRRLLVRVHGLRRLPERPDALPPGRVGRVGRQPGPSLGQSG
ncbi:hypothetical protein [Streptomyces beigongshangae]|uniref:hypothetical protein n=1 Tax=Streptomyces beigongshangae TaxID=2841597 RepID=UPI0021A8AACE|nr:hypothetical protein [Streptomyces sp. REN17]